MAGSKRDEAAQRAENQQEFRGAENANVIQQAGASLGDGRAPTPMPGGRLSGSEAEREIEGSPNQHGRSASYQAEIREMEQRKAATESEALREQYAGDAGDDTDSNLESGKVQARVEGLIGNPD